METLTRLHKPQFFSQRVWLFLFLFHADDFATFIVPAIGAYGMRKAHLAAIAAWHQVQRFQRVVSAPPVTSSFG
jgi:hypothetical protein